METVIVTRHPALVELLIERGLITEADRARVIEHAQPEDVIGRRVIGVLPLHLAALAERVIEIPLRLRPEHRGQELDLATLREIAAAPVEYSVCRVADVSDGDLAAMETSRHAARLRKACPRCRGLGGALGDGISSSIDEPCHSGPRVSSGGAILR